MGFFDFLVFIFLILAAVAISVSTGIINGQKIAFVVILIVIILFVMFIVWLVSKFLGSGFSLSKSKTGLKSYQAMDRINELLEKTYNERITRVSDNAEIHSTKFLHPKSHKEFQYWVMSGWTKHQKRRLLVFYSEEKDDITDTIIEPTTQMIENPWEYFEPVYYDRLLRRDDENEKNDNDGQVVVNYRSGNKKKEQDNSDYRRQKRRRRYRKRRGSGPKRRRDYYDD